MLGDLESAQRPQLKQIDDQASSFCARRTPARTVRATPASSSASFAQVGAESRSETQP